MKRFKLIVAAGFLSFFVSCTQKDRLPENPKDKQEYKDSQGNSWIYNAMLLRWAMMPSGANSAAYYYYPGNNTWMNSSGAKVDPPANVSKSVYQSSAKPNSHYSGSKKPASNKSFGSSHSKTRSVGA